MPLDGPGMDSQEFRQWALLDMGLVRLSYVHGRFDVPAHVWRAEKSIGIEVLRVWADHAQVVRQQVVPGADHMDIVRATGFVDGVARTLADIDSRIRKTSEAVDR